MKPLTRKEFLEKVGAGLLTASMASQVRSESAVNGTKRPHNVLLVVSDEHNPKVLSLQGHPTVQTPNMERLASRGVWFENAYCPSPLCMPCRSSVMSGRRVHEIQCYNNCNVFEMDYPSYGEVLREQGVHTVHCGKTDVYRPSSDLGFSELLLAHDRRRPGDKNIQRVPLAIRTGAAKRANGFGVRKDPFKGDIARTDAAVKWLRTTAPSLNKPWTLAVNLNKPHFPQTVTQELWDLYPEGGDLPKYGREAESANHPYARDLRSHFETDQFTEEQVRGLRRGYLGCVTFIDRELGRLLDALRASGLEENTVVAYTSDHGEMLGKFGMWWKCSLYEDSCRVPLIVAGPDFEPGTRTQTPVDLLDLQATLFEATQRQRPSDWTGTPLQKIPAYDSDRVVFSEYHGHGTRSGGYVIRKGDWKLIYCMNAPNQLFHLGEDPEELVNLARKKPDKQEELEEELRSICCPETENDRAHQFVGREIEALRRDTI